MTDLIEQAVAKLKQTTISYPEWERRRQQGKYADITKTMWWQAFDLLGQAQGSGVAEPGSTGQPVTYLPYSAIPLNIQASHGIHADIAIDEGSGDSAILVGNSSRFVSNVKLQRIRVRGAAKGNAVPWGKHGAYLDCYDSVLEDIDMECSSYAANGLSIRLGGIVVRRAAISGAQFVLGIFDSDTGQSDKTVLVEDVAGHNASDTCIWCDAQRDFKTTFDLKLTFRRVHLYGSPAFLKVSAARTAAASFVFEQCTLNSQPLQPSQVPAGSKIS